MIRGIDASTRGMATDQTKTDVLANNMANIDTTGFKRSVVTNGEFSSMLVQLSDPQLDGKPPIGTITGGSTVAQVLTDKSQGDVQFTGNDLDVALSGAGQFTFQGPNGLGYTRDGAFHRDSQGNVVTARGYQVLAGGKPFGAGSKSITFGVDGTVTLDGRPGPKLDIAGYDGKPVMGKSLEASNVDMTDEMTQMIVTLRSFQANSRALTIQDQELGRTVNDVGKV